MKHDRLFICNDYHIFLYSTFDVAVQQIACGNINVVAEETMLAAREQTAWWTIYTQELVTFTRPDWPIFLVEKTEFNNPDFWHVISGERSGWIIFKKWLNIKPLENNGIK